MNSAVKLAREGLRLVDRPLRVRLMLLALAALAISTFDVLGVLLMVPLVEIVEGESDAISIPVVNTVGPVALLSIVVGLFVAKSVATTLLRWWTLGVAAEANSRAASSVFSKIISAPLPFHDVRNTADSVRTITVSIRNFFDQGVIGATNLIAESITLLVLVGLLLSQSILAGVVALLYFGLAVMLYVRVVQRRTTPWARSAQSLQGRSVQLIQEGLGALAELQIRGTASYVEHSFEERQNALVGVKRRVLFSGELARYYLEIVFVGAVGVVAGVVFLTSPGAETLPTLALFLVIGVRTLPSLSRLLLSANKIRVGSAALDFITEDMNALAKFEAAIPQVDAQAAASWPRAASIAVSNVSFQYGQNTPEILRDVDLVIPPGTSAGLLGGSGSGKSTLLELICGLRDPTAGSVDLSLAGTEAPVRIGYVPQNVFAIDASIRENVTLGADATDEQVWEALEMACASKFVQGLTGKLHSPVGEAGVLLSGGQRQRIGLARAYLMKPNLLFLDEATAALDLDTERSVVEAMNGLRGIVTLLVVTHRLSTLRYCDQVLEVADGRLSNKKPSLQTVDLTV